MVIGALFETVGIGAIMPLMSIMGKEDFFTEHPSLQSLVEQIGITNHRELIIVFCFALIAFYVIKNLFLAFEAKQQISFVICNQMFFAKNLLREYLYKPYMFHLNTNPAILFQYINNGSATAFSYILMPLLFFVTEMVTMVIIFLLLVYVDWVTAIFVAIFLGGTLYVILKIFRQEIAKQGIIRNENCKIAIKWLNQSLGGIKEAKVMNKEDYFLHQYADTYAKFGKAEMSYYFVSALPKSIIETLVVGGLLLLVTIKLFIGESVSSIVQVVGVLSLAAFRLMPGINRMVGLLNGIKYQMPLFDNIYEQLLEIKQCANENVNYNQILTQNKDVRITFRDSIVVENLSFAYQEARKEVLHDINLRIPKGKFVGIVGESGAGKTTFVDLLLGLLEPVSGRLLVDGQDLAENMDGWHHILSYVPQSIYLIDATIKENIAFGVDREEIDVKQVQKALSMSGLTDFIETQPAGIDTMVGNRGVKLSGGQRQRIGIARALYTNPEVLILDEATSALDNQTEKEIMSTILGLKGQITIISIAHRLSTLEKCDFKVKFVAGNVQVIGDIE